MNTGSVPNRKPARKDNSNRGNEPGMLLNIENIYNGSIILIYPV